MCSTHVQTLHVYIIMYIGTCEYICMCHTSDIECVVYLHNFLLATLCVVSQAENDRDHCSSCSECQCWSEGHAEEFILTLEGHLPATIS